MFWNRHARAPLPESFIFGVATADHQCEAHVAGWDDIWDVWERQLGLHPRGRATDFWERYPEDIRLAQELGCRAFRVSIAWSRVEPQPGRFDTTVLTHYRQLIDTVRAVGMEPIVTLLHFVWPPHVQERGGLIAADFPSWFERYVSTVVEAVGSAVRYWIPINEPNGLVYGFIKPWWQVEYSSPPGLPSDTTIEDQIIAVGNVIRNLFRAHTSARLAIKGRLPDALVGSNPLPLGLPPWLQRFLDRNATHLRGHDELAKQAARLAVRPVARRPGTAPAPSPAVALGRELVSILDPLLKIYSVVTTGVTSNWWHLGMAGRLPEFLCPEDCIGQQDFVGFDYYWGVRNLSLNRIARLLDAANRHFSGAPVWPGALYDLIRYHARLFPGLPILICENGSVVKADGVDRGTYLRRHIDEVQRAVARGLPVVGYLCWSITTNREWGTFASPDNDFGLYHIALDSDPDLRRIATPSLETYRAIIAMRSASVAK